MIWFTPIQKSQDVKSSLGGRSRCSIADISMDNPAHKENIHFVRVFMFKIRERIIIWGEM